MKQFLLLLTLLLLTQTTQLFSQAGNDRLVEVQKPAQKDADSTWSSGGGLGLDFAQLALFNPRPGSGSNRIGVGGLGSLFANYKKNKFYWNNGGSFQLSVQRLGDKEEPFRKNLDVMRIGSRAGTQFISEKVFVAADFTFETILFKDFGGGLLKDTSDAANKLPLTKFLSPYRLSFAPGIDFKPGKNLSFFIAPASLRVTGAADAKGVKDVTQLGIKRNENSLVQIGGTVKGSYANKYYNGKVSISTSLDLFTNYLENPGKIDILWQNNLGWNLTKSISLNLVTELFYDYDVKDAMGNTHGVSFTEALLVKYNYIF